MKLENTPVFSQKKFRNHLQYSPKVPMSVFAAVHVQVISLTHRVSEVYSHTLSALHQAVLEVKVKPGWKAGTKAAGGGG